MSKFILGEVVEYNFNHGYWTPGVVTQVDFDRYYNCNLYQIEHHLEDGEFKGCICNLPEHAIRKLDITVEQAQLDERAHKIVAKSASPVRTLREYAEQMALAYATIVKEMP